MNKSGGAEAAAQIKPNDTGGAAARAEAVAAEFARARDAIGRIIFGQQEVVDQVLITLLSGGNGLIIGVPGLAKTRLVDTLGTVLGLDTKRIQFTPDLMPADIVGSEVLEEGDHGKRSFRFIKGPVFCQLLMADEINRASPRTQSALLQSMQEKHVTIAGTRYDLPKPFHVLATQNPIEQEGTYPLPEAQLDRFLMQIDIGYPGHDAERQVMMATTVGDEATPSRVTSAELLIDAQKSGAPPAGGREGGGVDIAFGARRAPRSGRQRYRVQLRRLGAVPARKPGLHACHSRARAFTGPVRAIHRRRGGTGPAGAAPPHGAEFFGARRRGHHSASDRRPVQRQPLNEAYEAKPGQRWSRTREEAERLAAALPPLLVAAETLAAAAALGVHGRRKAGMGETFWQFRRYQSEDPTTAIDWRQSAKSQHLFVREREWEAAESVWFWRDGGASMGFASSAEIPTKLERASVLALALASLLVRAGERIALVGGSHPPAGGRVALTRIAHALVNGSSQQTLPPRAELKRNSALVWFSDFLQPFDVIEQRMRLFAKAGVNGFLVQVNDPAEEDFPYSGRVRFQSPLLPDTAIVGRAEGVREAYRARFTAHVEAVGQLARRLGWSFTRHRTDRSPQTALIALYSAIGGAHARRGF